MDEFRLETIGQLHAVKTDFLVPFVVHRLGGDPKTTETILTVELQDIGTPGSEQRQLRLVWEGSSIPHLPLGLSETVITELAALGIACVVPWHFASLRLSAVSMYGDRFDYWVQRQSQRWALEISGTILGALADRHQIKVRQLLANPYNIGGFVVVVGFAARRVIFSFHHHQRDQS